MRLFIGIPVCPTPELGQACRALQRSHPGIRLVPPENWHVTLRFLGEMEEANLVIDAMRLAVEGVARFSLSIRGVGAFPEARCARVAWAGIDSERISRVEEKLRFATRELGSPPERRPFSPHLTLARLQPAENISDWVEKLRNRLFHRTVVEELVLYRSELGARGPVYIREAVGQLR